MENEAGPVRGGMGEGRGAFAPFGPQRWSECDNYPGVVGREVPGQVKQVPAEDAAASAARLQSSSRARPESVLPTGSPTGS